MKRVDFTDVAERELEEILRYISQNYPSIYSSFEMRLHAIIKRIGTWPESAPEIIERRGIRRVPFIRYPYKIFYAFCPTESKFCTSITARETKSFEL